MAGCIKKLYEFRSGISEAATDKGLKVRKKNNVVREIRRKIDKRHRRSAAVRQVVLYKPVWQDSSLLLLLLLLIIIIIILIIT